jgi:hypothetical protein
MPGMPRDHQGQAVEPTKSAMHELAGHRLAQVPGWLAALAAGGRACHLPFGHIPPPWAWWEIEAPATRAACSSSQTPLRLRLVDKNAMNVTRRATGIKRTDANSLLDFVVLTWVDIYRIDRRRLADRCLSKGRR